MYANARKYGLLQPDAAVFEGLLYMCRKSPTGSVRISYEKLGEFTLCRKKTVERAVKRLVSEGLVLLSAEGYKMGQNDPFVGQNDPSVGQNDPISKEKRTKKENIINNKSLPANNKPSGDGLAGFDEFWKNFSPVGEYVRRKKACQEYWLDDTKMTDDWRKLAIERASEHENQPNPYFWLCNEDFRKVGATAATKSEQEPHWFVGSEIDDALRAGIKLVSCRNPKTGNFGTVTKEDADKYHLEKSFNY